MAQPLEIHWRVVKRLLRYLKGSSNFGLLLCPSLHGAPFSLCAYNDVDWAMDPDDRRSTSGSCIFFGPILVSWSSKKQALLAKSRAEVGYRSVAHTTAELLWMQSLL